MVHSCRPHEGGVSEDKELVCVGGDDILDCPQAVLPWGGGCISEMVPSHSQEVSNDTLANVHVALQASTPRFYFAAVENTDFFFTVAR